MTICVPGRKAISSAAEPGVTRWMKMPVWFPPMTLICSSRASPWKASTVAWLGSFRAGRRRTGTLLQEGATELVCSPALPQPQHSGILHPPSCHDPTLKKAVAC